MVDMLIADAQVHIWADRNAELPWARSKVLPRPAPFSMDHALREMDVAGVRRAVLVPLMVGEVPNQPALDAARLHPDRFAVMGLLKLNLPGARAQFSNWRQQPGMLGLRLTSGQDPGEWLWAEAEAAGVPIMRSVSNPRLHFLEQTYQVAERHPRLKLVIDHLGIAHDASDDAAFSHMDTLLSLAELPNVAVKASCLPHYTSDSYPYRRLHPYIRRVYDAFGSRRMFWGSDLVRLPCTYLEAITMFTEEIPWFTSEDKEWIMGRGLCEWIGWR